jgi:hypothetical protein
LKQPPGISEDRINRLRDAGELRTEDLQDAITLCLSPLEEFFKIAYTTDAEPDSVIRVAQKLLMAASCEITEHFRFIESEGWSIELLQAQGRNSENVDPDQDLGVQISQKGAGHVE